MCPRGEQSGKGCKASLPPGACEDVAGPRTGRQLGPGGRMRPSLVWLPHAPLLAQAKDPTPALTPRACQAWPCSYQTWQVPGKRRHMLHTPRGSGPAHTIGTPLLYWQPLSPRLPGRTRPWPTTSLGPAPAGHHE